MEIHGNIINLFGFEVDLWIMIMTWLTMGIIILISWLATRKINLIPTGWQSLMEMFIQFIEDMLVGGLGKRGVKYCYFFGSIFIFILISNQLGLVPMMASPTREVSVTLGLALLVLIWMQYISIRENGIKAYLKHYIEPFAFFLPIHLMELATRPLTLALRLFGNIFAGEVLLEVLTENFRFGAPIFWLMLSVAIGTIQAYIFTVLSVSYTGVSVHDEH